MPKKLLLLLCVLLTLLLSVPARASFSYGASYYQAHPREVGNHRTETDPLYLFMNEVEGYLEGSAYIDAFKITDKLYFLESAGATFYTTIEAGNQSGNVAYTLPTADGTAGQILSTNGSGVLSWAADSGSGTFTGGNITSDCTLSDDVDFLPTTTITDTWAIKVYDTDAPGYLDVLRWTNATTPTIVLGSGTTSFALASTGVDIATTGAITNALSLVTSDLITAGGVLTGNSLVVTNGGTVGTTLGVTGLASFAGGVTLDDGDGASPSLILQDETNETLTVSKVDGGNATFTPGGATESVQILTGNLKVGNGTEEVTLNGEDAYVEGTLEVDAAARFDGAVTANSTLTVASDAAFSDQIAVTLGSNDEEITVTNTATNLTASSLVTLIMAAQDDQAYILTLQQTPDADADNDFLLLEDNAGDDKVAFSQGGTTLWTLDAASNVTINADTTASTTTAGVIDLNHQTATNGGTAISITTQLEDNATAAYGIDIDVDDDATGGETYYGLNVGNSAGTASTVVGINLEGTLDKGIASVVPAAGQYASIDAKTTANTGTSGVIDASFQSATHNAVFMDIDAQMGNAGANDTVRVIQIWLDDDDTAAAGSEQFIGVDVNSLDLTGNALVTAFNVSNADIAFRALKGSVLIGNGTPTITASDNDLYVTGTFEVDSTSNFDGALTMEEGLVLSNSPDTRLQITENSDTFGLIFGSNKVELASCDGTGITTIDCNNFIFEDMQYLAGRNGQKIDFSHNELIEFGDTEKIGFILNGTNILELGTDTGLTTLDLNDVDNITDVESIQYDDDALSKLMCTTVQLNAAEVNDLVGTPKQLVAAPGADYMIWPIEAVLILDAGSEVLVESADNLVIGWNNAAVVAGETIETTNFIDQAADTITNWHMAKDEINAAATIVNKNLAIKNDSGDFTGNHSRDAAMTVTIFYRLVKVGL